MVAQEAVAEPELEGEGEPEPEPPPGGSVPHAFLKVAGLHKGDLESRN